MAESRAAMTPSGDQYEPLNPAFLSAAHMGMHCSVSWQPTAWGGLPWFAVMICST